VQFGEGVLDLALLLGLQHRGFQQPRLSTPHQTNPTHQPHHHHPAETEGPITIHYNSYSEGSKVGTPATMEVDLVIGADGANSRVAKEIDAGEYDYAIAFQERIRIPGERRWCALGLEGGGGGAEGGWMHLDSGHRGAAGLKGLATLSSFGTSDSPLPPQS